MLNLIRADLYKSFHRMYLFIFMMVMAALSIFLNAVLATGGASLESSLNLVATNLFLYPLFLICMFADIVMAEENKEHTMKNTIAYGTTRTQLLMSKMVSTVLVACSVAFVTICVYLACAFLLLHPEKADLTPVLSDFFLRLGTTVLIYLAAAILATVLAGALKRNALFTFAYFVALVLPALMLKCLAFLNPVFVRIMNQTMLMQSQIVAAVPQNELIYCAVNALIHLVVFFILGLLVFRKQEIN